MKKLLMFVSILCIWISSSSQIISELSRWEYGPTEAVAVKDSTAYISSGSYLWVLDISDESNPVLLNEIKLENYIGYIRVIGNYLYVSKEDTLLNIYDIHTSDNPVLVNQIEGTDKDYPWKDIYTNGDTVYFCSLDWIYQYSLNDTLNPVYQRYVGFGYDMSKEDSLYSTCSDRDLTIFKITGSSNINTFTDYIHLSENVRGSALLYPYVYFGYGSRGIGVVDVSDIYNIVEKTNHITGGYTYDVELIDDTILIAAMGLNGIGIYDIESDTLFTLIGECETNGYPYELEVVGNRLYVGARSGGLIIVDISDLTNPTVLGEYRGYGECRRIALDGDRLYAASGDGGVMIMDITDRESASVISQCWTRGIAEDVVKQGNYLYVADGDSGLTVVDITDENNPSIYSSGYTDCYGNYAYIYGNTNVIGGKRRDITNDSILNGIGLMDIFDKSNPLLGTELMEEHNNIAFKGVDSLLHCVGSAGSYARYEIWNINNPYGPVLVDSLLYLLGSHGGVASNDSISAVNYLDTIYFYDVYSPANITYISKVQCPSMQAEMDIYDGYLFTTSIHPWLMVYDLKALPTIDTISFDTLRHQCYDINKTEQYLYLPYNQYGLSIYGFDTEAPMTFDIISPNQSDSIVNTNIDVVWESAEDIGIGIDKYEVYVGGAKVGETSDTTMEVSSVYTGSRNVWVLAYDKVGNMTSSDTINVSLYAGIVDKRKGIADELTIRCDIRGLSLTNTGKDERIIKVTDICGRVVKTIRLKGNTKVNYTPGSGVYFVTEKETGYRSKIIIIR